MKIAAVLVTFNRLNLLQQVLIAFENLTRKPDTLVVVNNFSNDGTFEYLNEWTKRTNLNVKLIHLDKNLGGSGGFHEGLKEALKTDSDWFWVSDDDAFPDSDAFEQADKYLQGNDKTNLGAICGAVINNSQVDLMHRRRLTGSFFKKEEIVQEYEYDKEEFELELFSYVGAIISRDALLKLGLTEKSFFIWYDDTEHSMRISKKYRIVCVPKIIITHDAIVEKKGHRSWKDYYGIRNEVMTYRKHYPLTVIYIAYKVFRAISVNLIKCRPISNSRVLFIGLVHGLIKKTGIDDYYFPGRKL